MSRQHLGDRQKAVHEGGRQEERLLVEVVFAGNLYQPAERGLAHAAVKEEVRQHCLAVIFEVVGADLQLQL